MKKVWSWFTALSLAIGTLLICIYCDTMAAVVLLISFIGIIAVLWVRFIADVLKDEAEEEAERRAEEKYRDMLENTEFHAVFKQYVGLGKGYEEV